MRVDRRFLRTSVQQADPLSWFIGPYLPVAFAALIFVFGTTATLLSWSLSPHPWLQLAGLWLCALAALITHVFTRPMRPPLGWWIGGLVLATASLGTVLSALDYRGTEFPVSLWWGPAGPGLILMGMAPYLSVRRVIVLGTTMSAIVTVFSMAILYPASDGFGPVMTALVIANAPAIATAGSAVFSYAIVSRVSRELENPSRVMVPGQKVVDSAVAHAERVTLARLTARAAPFLLRLAESGQVRPQDRALAGQLARRLRDDLVTQASETWLDSVAKDTRLVVVDPERLARRMVPAQRTAVLAMLRAILEMPETDTGSLLIELRSAADGGAAVAVSMDAALPEGRRIMHLAPYYLTLRTAVDDLVFDRDRMTFRIAGDGGPASPPSG